MSISILLFLIYYMESSMKIYFVTNNKLKVQVARNSLHKHGITVKQIVLWFARNTVRLCERDCYFSAKNAALVVGQPVIVGDTGFLLSPSVDFRVHISSILMKN